jgi:sugar transferase (PEP-CTERM system associated)
MLGTKPIRMRVSNNVILILADTCLTLLALTFATLLTSLNNWTLWYEIVQPKTLSRYALVVVALTVGLQYSGLHSFAITTRPYELIIRSLRGIGLAYVILAIVYALRPHFSLGGKTTSVAVLAILVGVLGWRIVLGTTQAAKSRIERILVLGTGAVGRELASLITSADDLDMEITGVLHDGAKETPLYADGFRILGHISDLETVVERERIDCVVISVSERRGRLPLQQLLRLKFAGVKVEDAHSMYERVSGRIPVEHLTPSWLFMSNGFNRAGLTLSVKYALDCLIALLLLSVFTPIMTVVALAIWIETGRPILYIQDRVGRRSKQFRMYKFRSMYNAPAASQAQWTSDGDNRITRVGRFIRKYRLDELPQLFNVLRGDMSLVGPRPEQPYFCQMLERQVPYFGERHSVRPGITGWAQIKYRYGSTIADSKTKLEYDLFYLKHMSPLLDLTILFYTVSVLLLGKGAK